MSVPALKRSKTGHPSNDEIQADQEKDSSHQLTAVPAQEADDRIEQRVEVVGRNEIYDDGRPDPAQRDGEQKNKGDRFVKGGTAATPMSLLAASAGISEEKLLALKSTPIDTTAAALIASGSKDRSRGVPAPLVNERPAT